MNYKSISSNIVYNVAYQILVLIVPLITAPYISRILGAEKLGVFSYISSIAYYFYIVIMLGLTNYGNRSVAKCREDKEQRSKVFWSIFFMQLSVGMTVIAAYCLYVEVFAEAELRLYLRVYSIYIIGAAFNISWFFFGMQQFKMTTIRSAIVKLVSFVCVFLFVRGPHALLMYMLIVSGSMLLSSLILWTQLKKTVSFYCPTIAEVFCHLWPNIVLFIPILAMSIYRVMDKIMIKNLSNMVQNGYYENADRIISISLTVFSAIATVMMPAIASMVAEGKRESINRILRDMMQTISFFSIAMTFGLMAIAQRFAPLFFGEQYQETGILLSGLSCTIFLSSWKSILRSQYLIPFEKDGAYVFSLVFGAIVNVIVNLLLIPQLGARGAVVGTLCAELTGFVIQTYSVGKDYPISTLFRDTIVFLPSGLIMGMATHYILLQLPYHILSIGAVIIIGVMLYVPLGIISLKCFDKKRYLYYKKMILHR